MSETQRIAPDDLDYLARLARDNDDDYLLAATSEALALRAECADMKQQIAGLSAGLDKVGRDYWRLKQELHDERLLRLMAEQEARHLLQQMAERHQGQVRCDRCGSYEAQDTTWRFNGVQWEHRCGDVHPVVGHWVVQPAGGLLPDWDGVTASVGHHADLPGHE